MRVPASALAATVFLVTMTAAAETKIAVVDLQRALEQTEDGMKAAATLRGFSQSRQQDLDKRQKSLAKEEEELRLQARILSRRSLQRRTEHWQRRMVEVQTKFIEYNKQLQKKQLDMLNPITQKLLGAVKRAAGRKGFDLVIDKAAVPFSRSDLDLTDLVVQLYNGGGGGEGEGEGEGEKGDE
jgi:outer membrane protein